MIVSTEYGLYDTTSANRSRNYSRIIVPTKNLLYCATSTIQNMYYLRKFVSNETVYVIPPVLSTAGIIHVRLYQIKTVYIIPQVILIEGIYHVRFCKLKTVYMIISVVSTAGIIEVSFANIKWSILYHQYNQLQVLFR